MKNTLTLLIGIAVLVILLVYMVTFQVRYDQVAVLTTFDKAVEPVLNDAGEIVDEGSLKREPGLYFKWPWPIQKDYKYSTQIHVLEDRLEEIQTADGFAVIVKLYLAWRIEDPYAFFRSLKNEENARQTALPPLLRQLRGVVSQYNFDQLVNTDPEKLKLREIEQKAAEQLRQQLVGIQPGYGISIEQVGISRVILPEATTEKVFARMRATRERMAQQARSEGEASANSIKSDANSARDRILAFAERRAQAIRAEGDLEAEQYFAQFRENQEFAIFMDQMDALREMLKHNTTFILDANKLWFLEPFTQPQQVETPAVAPEAGSTAAQRN